jgi:hypothetical protein
VLFSMWVTFAACGESDRHAQQAAIGGRRLSVAALIAVPARPHAFL